ncbi:response regulator transcription factor [Zavarzinia sp. CC-PAN008]|uniref:response regulator transcription factor n=1 Tax=Zavarzinia sp. CC-PAN008 TaxID=3243332 RepID=UPI003F7456B3
MASPEPGADEHLLLVDDDSLFADTLSGNLEDEGYRVTCASDGAAALSLLDGHRYDLILLDWRMPGMDGLSALKAIRARLPDLPVIFLTSLADPLYEEAALDRGAVDFVEKNRSLGVILKRIRLSLDRVRQAAASGGEAKPQPIATDEGIRLDVASGRAFWRGQEVPLTLSEFRVVRLMVERNGGDVTFRELYDAVRGENFRAGSGEDGYRANVRAMIKRIRAKFKELDDGFDRIDTYAGFGYRWLPHPPR